MKYIPRIVDNIISTYLETFGAICIRGPKWCGKTTTAEQHSRSIIKLQDPDFTDSYLKTASIKPSLLLKGDNPRLIDEWQDIPELWDAVRIDVDSKRGQTGLYILTGSSVVAKDKREKVHHSGTGRIAYIDMLPMSLYESGESNGKISLSELFENPDTDINGIEADLRIEDVIEVACRGGWPESINKNKNAQELIVKQYLKGLVESDISRLTGEKTNPNVLRQLLRSYARNICTLASKSSIIQDISSVQNISEPTYDKYEKALNELHIISDIPAWSPSIRSKSAIRAKPKRNLVDPSLAVAALGIKPEYYHTDLKSFGFIFESLAIRDLKAYATAQDGEISYYRDRYGLEADAVLNLSDGRYALIEFKLGGSGIEEGRTHLEKIRDLIIKYNETEKQCPLRIPDLMLVITAFGMAYRYPSGVCVIPLTVLKP